MAGLIRGFWKKLRNYDSRNMRATMPDGNTEWDILTLVVSNMLNLCLLIGTLWGKIPSQEIPRTSD